MILLQILKIKINTKEHKKNNNNNKKTRILSKLVQDFSR